MSTVNQQQGESTPRLMVYQARWPVCCIMLGEIDDGGLMRVRVSGLTIGIGLRDRIADGW